MISNDQKLTPRWSEPCCIKEQILNSYKLENLDGNELSGLFNARRLRKFVLWEGTELARQEESQGQQTQELENRKDCEENKEERVKNIEEGYERGSEEELEGEIEEDDVEGKRNHPWWKVDISQNEGCKNAAIKKEGHLE